MLLVSRKPTTSGVTWVSPSCTARLTRTLMSILSSVSIRSWRAGSVTPYRSRVMSHLPFQSLMLSPPMLCKLPPSPRRFLKILILRIRNFVWGSSKDQRKVHLITWDVVYRPKSQGDSDSGKQRTSTRHS
ncbi:hypothetical protein LINPERHAP1_LOCUS17311 [Linum perenne]